MKFRPLHDRVVVTRIEAEEKSAGGIIIPDTAKEKPQQGEVVAVGPGGRDEAGKLIPIDVKAGDRILFGKWSGTEVKIDGVEYLIMKESDIMGVLEAKPHKKAACHHASARSDPIHDRVNDSGGSWKNATSYVRREEMAAKEVKFSVEARDKMLHGIDILANAVRMTLGPKGRNVVLDKS